MCREWGGEGRGEETDRQTERKQRRNKPGWHVFTYGRPPMMPKPRPAPLSVCLKAECPFRNTKSLHPPSLSLFTSSLGGEGERAPLSTRFSSRSSSVRNQGPKGDVHNENDYVSTAACVRITPIAIQTPNPLPGLWQFVGLFSSGVPCGQACRARLPLKLGLSVLSPRGVPDISSSLHRLALTDSHSFPPRLLAAPTLAESQRDDSISHEGETADWMRLLTITGCCPTLTLHF